MGRSKKYALDDFTVDVSFFESDNKNMLLLRQRHGFIADAIYFKLNAMVFSHGYYYKFDTIENLCAEISAVYGGVFARLNKIEAVITDLVKLGLFDYGLFSKNVITSKEAQQHYLKAVKRRLISINENYWLLDKVDKACHSQLNLNANVNNINVNINNNKREHLNLTNTSIVSERNIKLSNKLINSAGAREQNKQNNTQNITRNIIGDDFDITVEELDELKKQFVDYLKLGYRDNEWLVESMLNHDTHKKYYDMVIDALLKASRLRHNITLSGATYGAEYFRDISKTINLDNIAKISDVVRHRADDVKNIDFFILGTIVKLFDNQC